jgi:hypothetical protein
MLLVLASTPARLQGLLVPVACLLAKRRSLAAARLWPIDLRPPGLLSLPNRGTVWLILVRLQLILVPL